MKFFPTDDTEVPRLKDGSALQGRVRWQPVKSLWYGFHFSLSLLGLWYFSLSAFALFAVTTSLTLCLGHSLGMHRRLIHQSYDCPLWLEYVLVYLGVLVGMAGPRGMTWQHDLRDWAQRQKQCHSYLRHGENFWRDGWWQLHCDLDLENPPHFAPESHLDDSAFYTWLERYWMWQQLPWALLFFFLGGLPWLIWGISVRLLVSISGHWLVGHFAHNRGHRNWHVHGAAVQGYNLPIAALLTMGESWHNNHHAFPGSAKLGLQPGQLDPGWWLLCCLQKMGLVWNIRLPADLAKRIELEEISG